MIDDLADTRSLVLGPKRFLYCQHFAGRGTAASCLQRLYCPGHEDPLWVVQYRFMGNDSLQVWLR